MEKNSAPKLDQNLIHENNHQNDEKFYKELLNPRHTNFDLKLRAWRTWAHPEDTNFFVCSSKRGESLFHFFFIPSFLSSFSASLLQHGVLKIGTNVKILRKDTTTRLKKSTKKDFLKGIGTHHEKNGIPYQVGPTPIRTIQFSFKRLSHIHSRIKS